MVRFTAVFSLLLLVSCTKDKIKPIELVKTEKITYNNTIKYLLNASCIACHASNSTVPMDNYTHVKALALSGQLEGSLNGNPNYIQMAQNGGLDSLQVTELIQWIQDGEIE